LSACHPHPRTPFLPHLPTPPLHSQSAQPVTEPAPPTTANPSHASLSHAPSPRQQGGRGSGAAFGRIKKNQTSKPADSPPPSPAPNQNKNYKQTSLGSVIKFNPVPGDRERALL
jgi:hypothetical protein